jgi:coproporphyrinogen III oxidase-like Fe-S oxidoreductase
MLLLRLRDGLDFAAFTARTRYDARQIYADQIDRLARPGLIEVDARGLRLTERGLAVADAVAAEFLMNA